MIYKIIITLALFATICGAQNSETKNIQHRVLIKTPSKEVYDDGIIREKFAGFKIRQNGKNVLSVGEIWDRPHEFIIQTGKYEIVYCKPGTNCCDSIFFELRSDTIINLHDKVK